MHRLLAMTATVALLGGSLGCFGYNPSARRWAYVADAILIAGGGATIALDVTGKPPPCMPDAMNNGCSYQSSISGAMVAGAVLAAAGVFGVLFNATRDNVKTSR
jgi:hypothetical protein